MKSPVKVEPGGRGILKVNKSEGSTLLWFHDGFLIDVSQDKHYKFVDTEGSSGSELEISDARANHGGLYVVVAREGDCRVRKDIAVQVQGKYGQKVT